MPRFYRFKKSGLLSVIHITIKILMKCDSVKIGCLSCHIFQHWFTIICLKVVEFVFQSQMSDRVLWGVWQGSVGCPIWRCGVSDRVPGSVSPFLSVPHVPLSVSHMQAHRPACQSIYFASTPGTELQYRTFQVFCGKWNLTLTWRFFVNKDKLDRIVK